MHRPSSTALSARARALIEQMHLAEHWVYAVPSDAAQASLGARVTRIVATQRDDLDVTLLDARGEDAASDLAKVLEETGFFAQSTLLDSAFDVSTADARTALQTLAHMAVCWDAAWAELFALHLQDADAPVRDNAVSALVVAARTCGSWDGCRELLESACAREHDAAVRTAIERALATSNAPLAKDDTSK